MADDGCLTGLEEEDASWHVLCGSDRLGPYRLSDLLCAIGNSLIKSNDLIWRPGWSDWRELRSIASLLSPSLAGMFDCEDPALPAATPAPVLVHKLELKLRPEDRKKSWFEQLNRNHVDLIAN